MSRTVDLVEAFVSKRPPVDVETLQQARFELVDPDDPESAMRRLLDATVPTNYCWRLDVGPTTYWICQDQDEKLQRANQALGQDEDPGSVVGTLAKVSVDGTALHYGPIDLHAAAWERIQVGVKLFTT